MHLAEEWGINIPASAVALKDHKEVKIMGEVLLQYKIKGSSPDVDLEAIAKSIREKLATVDDRIKMQDGVKIEPLYFGIKGATVQFIIPEEDGMQDKLEEYIKEFEGVEDAELTFVSRL